MGRESSESLKQTELQRLMTLEVEEGGCNCSSDLIKTEAHGANVTVGRRRRVAVIQQGHLEGT